MRYALLACLLLLAPLSAQSIESLHDLRRDAESNISAKKYEEARVALRDAALIARSVEYPELEVTCLLRLGQLLRWSDTGITDEAAADRLSETALIIATRAGLHEKEAAALDRLRGRSDEDWKACAAASLAWGGFATFEYQWQIENDPKLTDNDARRAFLKTCMDIADERARVRLETHALTLPEGAAERIIALSDKAAKAGLARLALAILEDGRDLLPAVALKRLEQLEGTERYRDIAEAIAETTTTSPKEEEREAVEAALLRAYGYAGTARDLPLQIRLAGMLQKLTGKQRWSAIADSLRQRQMWELISDGQRAVRDDFFLYDGLIERLEQHADDPQIALVLLQLRGDAKPGDSSAYEEALKAALADEKARPSAAVIAEVSGRHEGFAVLVASLAEKGNSQQLAWAIETLARQEDLETLFKLLDHEDWAVREVAAAAMFRLDTSEVGGRIIFAAIKRPTSGHTLYLTGCMAKAGLPAALRDLEKEAAGENEARRAIAAGILASLGFATPIATIHTMLDADKPNATIPRALGRMPRNWGEDLMYRASRVDNIHAARAAFVRGDKRRARRVFSNHPYSTVYLSPDPSKGDLSRGNEMELVEAASTAESDNVRDLNTWAADRAGAQGSELDAASAAPENESEERPLHRLARTERETTPLTAGNRKRLVLIDIDGNGMARCAIEFEVGTAEIVDNQLRIPYRWTMKIDAIGSSLAGIMYKQVVLAMAAADVLDSATIEIPGYEAIKAGFSGGSNGWSFVVASLPYEELGEGLGDNTPAPLDEVVQGKLKVHFDFNGNPGNLEFPLRYVAPPAGDKPDLLPQSIVLDPPVPELGTSARIYLRVVNNGKAVGDVAVSSVRFMIKNPQNEDGWRTLDARVFSPRGWRPGEVRTFEVRPKFVDGYYMNTYSYTYTPDIGDTTIRAIVDPDNTVKEMNEDNNQIDIESPLQFDEEKGSELAEAEALEALKQPAADLTAATNLAEIDDAYGRAYSIFERLKNKSPAVTIMIRHLYASFSLKEARFRAEDALKELKEARDSGNLTEVKARSIRRKLIRAQEDYLRAGVPVKVTTLERARNATLAAANTSAAIDDYAQLNYALNRYDSPDSPAGEATRYLKALDGALLAVREAERLRETGEMDIGNVMDATSNFADSVNLKLPGFSNLHRELLKAELEYADKGMRKEADAIDALSDVIAGKEGAQERLNQAVGDVESHVKAGPFTTDAIKNIAKGWVKDIPIIGQIADIIFSWK